MTKAILRRMTRQRKVILDELRRVTTHPTADIIFKMARKKIPFISFGTVYRNLNILKAQGLILELTCGRYSCRYDGNIRNHYHLFCLGCEKIFDLNEPVSKELEKKLSKKYNFEIRYHRMEFYGYCNGCRGKFNRR